MSAVLDDMSRRVVASLCALLGLALSSLAWLPAPASAAPVPPGGATARRCFVEAVHLTFLERSATPAELDEWVATLGGGTPRSTLVRALANSDEWLGVTVTGIYRLALDRDPEPEGLEYWVGELRDGALVNRIGAQIFGSGEFYARAGGTDTGFVTELYDLILGRTPDAEGLTYWQGEIDRRGRGGVAAQFYASNESRSQRVTGIYDRLLDRAPEPDGAAFWVARLSSVNDIELAVQVASTAEYEARTRASCTFALEVDFVDLPDAVVGEPYEADLEAIGGQGPFTWVVEGLPDGLSVVGQQVVGTPTESGTFILSATVTDAEGAEVVDRSGRIDVAPAAIVDLDMSSFHTCAVTADGALRCWGFTSSGQTGLPTAANRPTVVTTVTGAIGVTTGGLFSCALIETGAVRCFGADDVGQLGNGPGGGGATPVTVSGLGDAVEVDAGSSAACARRAGGTVVCWGEGTNGRLGNGATTTSDVPVPVTGLTGVAQVAVGSASACARKTDGTVACWGRGDGGRLGNGASTDSTVPVPVSGITTARWLSAGGSHTCAGLTDGTVRCWGTNTRGQLGDGTTSARATPVVVTGLTGVSVVAAGASHTCASSVDGTVRCWGWNNNGSLGQGAGSPLPENVTTPVVVPGLTDVLGVVTGDRNAFALSTDGSLRAWGVNGAGQLGLGTNFTARLSPEIVPFPFP